MENSDELKAAEETGSFFESRAATGSAHFGYRRRLDRAVPAARRHPLGRAQGNTDGIHIEQMGLAGLVDAAVVLQGRRHAHEHRLGARVALPPPRRLCAAARSSQTPQLRAGERGVTTHRQITRVLGGGTHTDPGPGYPLGYVIRRAHVFAGI